MSKKSGLTNRDVVNHGWVLYSHDGSGELSDGWAGDSPRREYFIKKEAPDV